jgi:cytochrome c-type biogenesis protein CcmH
MAQSPPTERRLQPATLVLALAALIAVGVFAYTMGVRHGQGGSTADTNASIPATNATAGADPGQQGDIAAAQARIQQLQETLRREPDNHQAWFDLGLAWKGVGDIPQAVQAFRRAMELQPGNVDYVDFLGEALLIQSTRARQPIPPEAEQLFRRALALQPADPRSRFYLATIRDLRGDHRGAVDDLLALLREAPPGAGWTPQVRSAVQAIAQDNNIDISSRLPPESPAAVAGANGGSGADIATAGIPGPTPDQLRAASSMTPSQQNDMGRSMVDQLAGRLRQNPRNARGWIMLMRSRMALNEPPLAAAALRDGLAAFQNDATTQAQLRQAAQALGVPGA